jgi:hypothetical protein
LCVALVVLASRLPFLGPGFGIDSDAWRVAWSARTLAGGGGYDVSRLPGYPVQELASALLWPLGPAALTGASALMSALAAGCFTLILRRLGSRDGVLAGLALASTPALFIVSVQSLDFAWALAFALAAFTFALRGRAIVSGVLLGLAVGCRIPSLVWAVPLAIVIANTRPEGTRARAALVLVGCAGLVAAAAFLPVFLRYGPGFFHFYGEGYPSLFFVAKNAATCGHSRNARAPDRRGRNVSSVASAVRSAAPRRGSIWRACVIGAHGRGFCGRRWRPTI